MSALDRVLCDYPLPDPRGQDRESALYSGDGRRRFVTDPI
jgi:hypothetical protein